LQLAHGVSGGLFVPFIKAWTKAEGKKDQEILQAAHNSNPPWPWSTATEFQNRLEEAGCLPVKRRRQSLLTFADPTFALQKQLAGR
jgi:hypothetical protein